MNSSNAHLYLPLVQALADGKTIQIQIGDQWQDREDVNFGVNPNAYRIKPLSFAPIPDGSTRHNPDGLTAEQVGDGWRLTTDQENKKMREEGVCTKECYAWLDNEWSSRGNWNGGSLSCTYRVPLSTPYPDGSKIVDGKLVKPWQPKFKVGDRVQSFDGTFKGPISLINYSTATFHIEGCSLDWTDENVIPLPEPAAQVPLEIEDVPGGSLFRWPEGKESRFSLMTMNHTYVYFADSTLFKKTWEWLMDNAQILRPGQTEWLPCSKPA